MGSFIYYFLIHGHFIKLKAGKTQNTVFGYKKWSKIQSDKIFWSATCKLWVVSFDIFELWPFYKSKNWKRQNTVFGYKKWSKIQSDKIFSSVNPKLWVVSFATFGSKSFLTKGRNPMFSRTFRRIFLGMVCFLPLFFLFFKMVQKSKKKVNFVLQKSAVFTDFSEKRTRDI